MSEKEIAFIGKITAGVTHEINNALASIKEASGLLEDIVSMSPEESFPHHDKFLRVLPKIREQVQRSVKLTKQLNKFSHLTDEHTAQIELNDFIEHIVFLTQRFARNKKIKLEYIPAEQAVNINTVPIQLQMALYNCILYFLNNSSDGGSILIQPNLNEDQNSVNVTYEGELAEGAKLFHNSSSSEELLTLNDVISSVGWNVEFNEPSKNITLKFNL